MFALPVIPTPNAAKYGESMDLAAYKGKAYATRLFNPSSNNFHSQFLRTLKSSIEIAILIGLPIKARSSILQPQNAFEKYKTRCMFLSPEET